MTTHDTILKAYKAKSVAAHLSRKEKAEALEAMAAAIEESSSEILKINAQDVRAARGKFSPVMLDRLKLNSDRIKDMAEGLRAVAALHEPTGEVLEENVRADGLIIRKIAVPLGVVAVIYESRPNVTADVAALCLKSGNACILRSGKEAHATSKAIVEAMRKGLKSKKINPDIIGFIDDTSHEGAQELMAAKGYVDVLIPRGGAELIKSCVENAKVPCIETGTGICHIYVDKEADFQMALKVIENAKCSRPSVCNAMEVCLVDRQIAGYFLPLLRKKLISDRRGNPVQLRCDKESYDILKGDKWCSLAQEGDFDTEFLDYIMAVAVVDGVNGAIEHIAAHSTGHSDGIITADKNAATTFVSAVDSAVVYVNASTRFTDGGEFGLGCEVGISTQKLHARGPMGLKELTSYKYVVIGEGHIR